MKLRNKRTGEIVDTLCSYDITKGISLGIDHHDGNPTMACYNSLAELNEEWEDYEEQKGNWTIDPMNENYIDNGRYTAPDELERYEELGLKFNTEEEAKNAVEKLQAWKRLKDKGFDFVGCFKDNTINYEFVERPLDYDEAEEAEQDLAFLFGGEE